jgi:hypothetical protein
LTVSVGARASRPDEVDPRTISVIAAAAGITATATCSTRPNPAVMRLPSSPPAHAEPRKPGSIQHGRATPAVATVSGPKTFGSMCGQVGALHPDDLCGSDADSFVHQQLAADHRAVGTVRQADHDDHGPDAGSDHRRR